MYWNYCWSLFCIIKQFSFSDEFHPQNEKGNIILLESLGKINCWHFAAAAFSWNFTSIKHVFFFFLIYFSIHDGYPTLSLKILLMDSRWIKLISCCGVSLRCVCKVAGTLVFIYSKREHHANLSHGEAVFSCVLRLCGWQHYSSLGDRSK